jgi:hypothetical protein
LSSRFSVLIIVERKIVPARDSVWQVPPRRSWPKPIAIVEFRPEHDHFPLDGEFAMWWG